MGRQEREAVGQEEESEEEMTALEFGGQDDFSWLQGCAEGD